MMGSGHTIFVDTTDWTFLKQACFIINIFQAAGLMVITDSYMDLGYTAESSEPFPCKFHWLYLLPVNYARTANTTYLVRISINGYQLTSHIIVMRSDQRMHMFLIGLNSRLQHETQERVMPWTGHIFICYFIAVMCNIRRGPGGELFHGV